MKHKVYFCKRPEMKDAVDYISEKDLNKECPYGY